MNRLTRKQILEHKYFDNLDWTIEGLVFPNRPLGVTKEVNKKRYYFDYHPEHDVYIRLALVTNKKVSQEMLDSAENLGITREEYLDNAENKRVEIEDMKALITELWEATGAPKGHYPYNSYVQIAVGVYTDKLGKLTCKTLRHGYKRESKQIDGSVGLVYQWLQPNHADHIAGKMRSSRARMIIADCLYLKRRWLTTGKLPEMTVRVQCILARNEGLTLTGLYMEIFNYLDTEQIRRHFLDKSGRGTNTQ